jgi:hypothetical protein
MLRYDIILAAHLSLWISVLTPRIIRSRVEETFGLESGRLGAKEYKDALKQVASDEALVC